MARIQERRVPLCLRRGLLGIGFLLACFAGAQTAFTQDAVARPFVALKRSVFTANAKLEPVIQAETFARRSDGSYVRSFQAPSPAGEMGWVVEILDLRKGVEITLDPFTKSAITFYRSPEELRQWLSTQPNCEKAGLADETRLRTAGARNRLFGREVIKVQEQTDGETKEQWVDPRLDCYPLQETLTFSSGSHQEHTITGLQEQEPPDSLFEIPAGYAERSPWQVEMMYQSKYPGHVFWGSERAKVIDERYSKSRRNP